MNPLYILPFDHRSSFAKKLFEFDYPIKTKAQAKRMTAMKQIVFEAVLLAQKELDHPEVAGILVEEEFGAPILEAATKLPVIRAVTVEKSGQKLFDFQYGKSFAKHLEKYQPHFAKVLIRYNHADKKTNLIQNARLKEVSRFCKKHRMGFMLEVLLEGKNSRFTQMKRMIQTLEAEGIKPTVWKLEGLERASQWNVIKSLTNADLIILGHGKTKKDVEVWVKEAAQSGVVRGFAIGRTIFFSPLKAYVAKKYTRKQTIQKIAHNYLSFIKLFEAHRG